MQAIILVTTDTGIPTNPNLASLHVETSRTRGHRLFLSLAQLVPKSIEFVSVDETDGSSLLVALGGM